MGAHAAPLYQRQWVVELFQEHGVSAGARALFDEIVRRARDGACSVPQETFAAIQELTSRTIRRYESELEQAGLLKRRRRAVLAGGSVRTLVLSGDEEGESELPAGAQEEPRPDTQVRSGADTPVRSSTLLKEQERVMTWGDDSVPSEEGEPTTGAFGKLVTECREALGLRPQFLSFVRKQLRARLRRYSDPSSASEALDRDVRALVERCGAARNPAGAFVSTLKRSTWRSLPSPGSEAAAVRAREQRASATEDELGAPKSVPSRWEYLDGEDEPWNATAEGHRLVNELRLVAQEVKSKRPEVRSRIECLGRSLRTLGDVRAALDQVRSWERGAPCE